MSTVNSSRVIHVYNNKIVKTRMDARQPCDNLQSITRTLESIKTQSNYLYRSLNIIKQVCFAFALTRTQSRKVELPLNPKPIVFFKSKLPLKPMAITLAKLAKITAQSRFPCSILNFQIQATSFGQSPETKFWLLPNTRTL